MYATYSVKKQAYVNGKLFRVGEVVPYFPGIETNKAFSGIGEPLTAEEPQTDEIKRAGAGKWKLPNGDIVPGKLADAQEYWQKIKEGG